MIELTNEKIRAFIIAQGLGTPEPGRLHLLGLRSARPVNGTTITRIEPLPDHYDDTLVAFGTELACFPCTVDPGLKYTWLPLNPGGCAHLANGGPYRFVKGLHKGKPALKQAGEFSIWRDRNRNGRQDPDEWTRAETGNGIDLHRGGTSAVVGAWSAGCQVIPAAHWPAFWQVIERSGQTQFQYWLLDAASWG